MMNVAPKNMSMDEKSTTSGIAMNGSECIRSKDEEITLESKIVQQKEAKSVSVKKSTKNSSFKKSKGDVDTPLKNKFIGIEEKEGYEYESFNKPRRSFRDDPKYGGKLI